MKKKLLGELPLKSIELSKQWETKWLASAKQIEVAGETLLLINLYKNDKEKKEVPPLFRVFISHTDDITQDIEKGTWNKKKIEYVMDGWQWINNRYQFINQESAQQIEQYLGKGNYYKGLERANDHQYGLRSERANRTYDLRVKRIKEEIDAVSALPNPVDFNDFIDENAFLHERYAFYTTNSSRRYFEVTCSHCKKSYNIDSKVKDKPKHNEKGICEHCKSHVVFKSFGKVKNIYEYKEVILMLKYKQGFVSKYYEVRKHSAKGYEGYKCREKVRAIYTGEKVKTYYRNKYNDSWWDSNGYQVNYGRGVLYSNNIKEILKDTVFKYSALELLATCETGYLINQDGFLSKFENNPYLEYFIKMGLFNLANDIIACYDIPSAINAAGKNVTEILQLPKQQINRMIQLNGNLYTLQLLQIEEREGKKFTDEQISFLTGHNIRLSRFEQVLKFTTITKAIKYLSIKRTYSSVSNALNDWIDYLENCKTLNYNIKDEFILFPRHLKQAHDNLTSIILQKKQEKNEELFIERMLLARSDYEYKTKTYAVVIPGCTDDITKEGHTLKHCVGTYINRVAEGKTTIVFIRKVKDLSSPFFTMEITKGEIIQVRGKNNCAMTAEVKRFVESFKINKLRQKTESEAV